MLNTRQMLFVKYKLEGHTNANAAEMAGYSEKSKYAVATKLMKNPEIREAIGISLDKLGITFEKAVKPIADALEATKTVAHKRWVKGENGDLFEEMYVETELDHLTRLKASSMALKLLDSQNTEKEQKPVTNPLVSLQDNIQGMDEVQLLGAVFKKNKDD